MNTSNSFGFVLLGVLMALFPAVWPQSFPPTGLDGTSTRALWLGVVGAAQIVIGVSFLLQLWANRAIGRLASFALPTLDRSPLPTSALERGRVA